MLRHRYTARGVFDPSNIVPLFAPLEDDVVNEDAYTDAAAAGIAAVPDLEHVQKPTPASIAEIWLSKSRKYAAQFPQRIADDVSAAAYDAEAQASDDGVDGDDRTDFIMNAIDERIEAHRANALQYAEPPWGAGNNGYGAALEASGVLMDWVTEPGACDICAPMPQGNPYTMQSLPMWPGDPHPNCRCHVTPDDETWQSIFGDHAGE